MLSKSCAIRTISTGGLQCSSWPGCFRIRWHFYALLAIRVRPPSCSTVRAFPKCLLAVWALEHTICTMCIFKSCLQNCLPLLTCGTLDVHLAAMFGRRTSDFTSVTLNIFQTACKRSAANVLIFMDKRAMLILFLNWVCKTKQRNFCTSKEAV